ncbi:MAG: hypothetical protein IJJ71_02700 [Treponema sp.]|uniref:hypothetical protein n=1 Tax=Treponema sp. TaxID=166 RepID=UPI0025F70053|nr:hypothetical protein [Treponema sp.]MBQ9623794.1 hypothetical protein [Treponema sp.]MBR0495068.1 hypothetical protein [Treponema sp.]
MKSEIILTATIWFFVLIFFILACVRCRRVRVVPSLVIIISVTFFALLSPSGEVLLTLGRLKVTLDSLLLGLRRSGILVGMVFLSRALISPQNNDSFLKHFGKAGNKLTEVFFWLNLLTEKKFSFKKGLIIQQIDERLLEIWGNNLPEDENSCNS